MSLLLSDENLLSNLKNKNSKKIWLKISYNTKVESIVQEKKKKKKEKKKIIKKKLKKQS